MILKLIQSGPLWKQSKPTDNLGMENSNLIRPKAFVIGLFILSVTWGCTRDNGRNTKISLSMADLYSQEPSSKNAGGRIVKVAINVHGGPRLITGGWESCHCLPDGQAEYPPAIFALPVDPGPSRLVQVLIVSEDLSGKTAFSYGDKGINIVNGDNPVEIIVKSIFSSEESAEAGIRYLRADGTGPTGWVDLIYKPPSDRPPMIVDSSFVLGGWMKVHLFQTTPVDYKLRETGEILFSGLNFSHPDFQASNRMIRARFPIFYGDKNHDGSAPYELFPAGTIFLGFAGPGATTQVVCYDPANGLGLEKAWLTMDGTTPLLWSGSTENSGHFSRVGGGVNKTLTPCTSGTNYVNKLSLLHDELQGDWTSALFGFERAFQHAKGNHGPTQATSFYQPHISASQISWKFLPGVFVGPGAIAGVKIFKRFDPNSSNFHVGGDRFDCSQLPALGFTEIARLNGPLAESFLMRDLPQASVYNHIAFICPFDQGEKFIPGTAAQVHDIGTGALEFGNGADSNRTIASSISSPDVDTTVLSTKVLMAKRQVHSVSPDGRSLGLGASPINSPYPEFEAGDEIIWMVLLDTGPNGCGPELGPGNYGFNRVASAISSPASISLQAPLVLDGAGVSSTALQSVGVTSGTDVCRIFVQRVPNFYDLALSATSAVTMVNAAGLTTSVAGGGLIAFRVLNELSYVGNYNFNITSSGNGFQGGIYTASSATGIGYLGNESNTNSYVGNAGGAMTLYGGGGGGGAGPGGNGGSASGTSSGGQGGQSLDSLFCGGGCDPNFRIFFGGGGGSGNPAGSQGGAGGGAVLISAKRILRTSGTGLSIIRADGSNGGNTSATGDDSGGGGGGGTIVVRTKDLATSLSLYAVGGPGGNATGAGTARGGGGGGGGHVFGLACSGTGSFGTPDVTGGIFGTGSESNGASGSAGGSQTQINSNVGSHCH